MFTAPWVLLGLAALPGLYFLLRLTPPSPRRIAFPPLALLRGLPPAERAAHRMPLWLLLLRLAAAGLVILGLAGPALHPPPVLPGRGPVLLVIDNGWAAAADWPRVTDAARQVIAAARQAGRGVAVLATARNAAGTAPQIQGVMTAAQAAQIINALQPWPWPVDRHAAAAALADTRESTRIYLADGITDGPGFAGFLNALRPTRVIAADDKASLLLPPSFGVDGALVAHAVGVGANAAVLAETASGDVLARADLSKSGDAVLSLPLPLRDRVTKLVLEGPASAGNVFLLDRGALGSLVGLAASGAADTPFLGALFFAGNALPASAKAVTGDLAGLIADRANVIILADVALSPAQLRMASDWIAAGGEMIRFAGPLTADQPDDLSPDPLLAGDRRLGGALTWTTPQSLAPFPDASPLAGLPVRGTVSATPANVSRQILADPTRLQAGTVWASLADGTPLVLGKAIGRGLLISVLTTANADWSNLALTGIYPAMLGRLIGLVHGMPVQRNTALPLQSALDAFGQLVPPSGLGSITANAAPQITISPAHPPGYYGNGAGLALNLGGHILPPVAALLPGAEPLGTPRPPVDFGAMLLDAAIWLLVLDLLISLRLRGVLPARPGRTRPGRTRRGVLAGFCGVFLLQTAPARAQAMIPQAALQTELAYIRTGDAPTDQLSADALAYLSALVSARSSAQLGDPVGLDPGTDDIDLFPLIYWPVLAAAPAPSAKACSALVGYMQHGGLLLIDSQGSDANAAGSGAGFAPGAAAALSRVTACLDLPPMEPLTTANAIAHSFYILPSFAGKFVGDPVLIANAAARDADGVTPVVIGQNDWAGAWARDANGDAEQTPLPGGEDQRVIADRFGTNLVIYALTGDYKSDQSRLPAFLDAMSP
jgi:hypothetical protein